MKSIEKLGYIQKLFFANILNSRLIFNYSYFSKLYSFWDAKVLENAVNFIWLNLYVEHNENEVKKMIESVEEITPDTEDFDTVFVSFALDACTSVLSTLQYILDKNEKFLKDVIVYTFDSVDRFIQEKMQLDCDNLEYEEKIANHPLMKQENEFQLDLIDQIYQNSIEEIKNITINKIFDLSEIVSTN